MDGESGYTLDDGDPIPESINDIQIGGGHYKDDPIEIWDFLALNKVAWLEGNIIKYTHRWRKKNGMQDLQKAKHYLDKLIETAQNEGYE